MGAARIPLAAVQRRILLVAAVEDKRSAFAETRLMSGAKAVQGAFAFRSLAAQWRDVGAGCPKLGTLFRRQLGEGLAYD